VKAYLARVALAFDILANAVLLGRVETLSSRMGKSIKAGSRCILCRLVCGLLDLRWKGHCVNNVMEPVDKGGV
jgi:hypothetical protein